MIAEGVVTAIGAGTVEARMPRVAIGEGVRIATAFGMRTAEVSAVQNQSACLGVHGTTEGIAEGDRVFVDPAALLIPAGTALLGRCIDAQAVPLDGGAPPQGRLRRVRPTAPAPSERAPICMPFWTGVRAIDALLTLGRGARAGIFAPPGAGKSTLLHSIVRGACADAIVVGLVGERGREAEEWMRMVPQHATIVCATSDRSPYERIRAAWSAMAQADALRSHGLDVLLILDSLARFAAALREAALANGESVGRAGFPPSVFAEMARLLEVAGTARRGSITLLASVLSDGDERDPVSDAARSLLDGHVQLSAALAQAGHFPAIDVLASASRTMSGVAAPEHRSAADSIRQAMAALAETADARALGIAPEGAQAARALAAESQIQELLRQDAEPSPVGETLSAVHRLADTLR